MIGCASACSHLRGGAADGSRGEACLAPTKFSAVLRASQRRQGPCMTIVCRSRKFIFVHLHKCGGTSVEQAFAPHARWNDLVIGSTFWGELLQPLYKRRYGLTKHSRASA